MLVSDRSDGEDRKNGKFRILNLGLEIPIVFSFFLFVLEFLRRREKFQNRCDK